MFPDSIPFVVYFPVCIAIFVFAWFGGRRSSHIGDKNYNYGYRRGRADGEENGRRVALEKANPQPQPEARDAK